MRKIKTSFEIGELLCIGIKRAEELRILIKTMQAMAGNRQPQEDLSKTDTLVAEAQSLMKKHTSCKYKRTKTI